MSLEANSESGKTYTKVCKKHGLRYDPALTSGCVRCRREMEVKRESSGAGFRAFAALAAIVAIVLVVLFLSRGEPGEQPPAAEPVEIVAEPVSETASGPGQSGLRLTGKTTVEGIIQNIRRLVARGRSETAEFNNVGVVPEELREQWAQWSAEWIYRVDEITERVRRRSGGQADPALILAYDELEKAVEELRQIANITDPGGVSFASDCDLRFGTAEQSLNVAQRHLDGMNTGK